MKILDLFCGGGGAAWGYHLAWPHAEIVGVDINRQGNYPFTFIQGCAVDFLEFDPRAKDFDFIHASPPCQRYTKKSANWGRKRTHWTEYPGLIAPIRTLLRKLDAPYVIENVPGAPIRQDLILCGTMFGLNIKKHRYFETSFPLVPPGECGNHKGLYSPWSGKGRNAEKFRAAVGIDWLPCSGGASRKAGYTGDLSNAIPPAYTRWIARQFDIYKTTKGERCE